MGDAGAVAPRPLPPMPPSRAVNHVVSADLVQVYHGADIGSNKPTDVKLRCMPHHLIDVADPPIVVVVVVNDVVISYDTIIYS